MVAVELIRNLQNLDKVNQYFIFVNPDEDNAVIQPSANFELVPLKKSPYPIWEQLLLPKAVKKYQLDLLHCTSNTAPLNLKIPLILTLHDIIYLEKMDWKSGSLYQRLGNLYRKWNVPWVVKKAAKILTVSKFEQKRIKDHFGLDDKKVEVIYNGIGQQFKPLDFETVKLKRKKLGLPEQYALFLGNTDPKKNLRNILKAIKILNDKGELNITCVITDLSDEILSPILKDLDAEGIRDKIVLTGYVRNEDMPVLYNSALFFIYVSLRESFGLPILEAMASGCPVLTSNTSSMPEVAGEAALLVDPTDPKAISNSLQTLIKDNTLRADLREKGLQRPLLFEYKTRVERIIAIYQEVYRQNNE